MMIVAILLLLLSLALLVGAIIIGFYLRDHEAKRKDHPPWPMGS